MRLPVGLHLGVAAVAIAVAALLTDRAPEVEEVLTWKDPAIEESSGLVATDDHLLTVNDSGNGPVLFVVDRESGETVGRTTYTDDEVQDVEALSPGLDGSVWIGDIGDNTASRDQVSVYAVPSVAEGERTLDARRFDLVYRGGPRDAEALLVHPVTGRLYVVSKGILGGRVYEAPARLRAHRPNLLTPVGRSPAWVTDGAFLPDGGHAILRTYASAVLFEVPRWRVAARMRLQDQRQGEGMAVSRPPTTVLVSTEGRHSQVLSVPLSEEVVSAIEETAGTPSSSSSPADSTALAPSAGSGWLDGGWPDGTVAAAGAGVLALAAGLALLVRRRRRAKVTVTP